MGVVDLMIVIPATIGAILFLMDTGLGMYDKSKLSFVATQAASFAASLPQNQDPTEQTKQLVSDLMKSMAIPSKAVKVGVSRITLAGRPGINVQISDEFPLFGQASFLPAKISLQDNASALSAGGGPTMLFPIDNAGPVPFQFVEVPVTNVIPVGQTVQPGSFRLGLHFNPSEVVAQPRTAAF